MGNESKKMITDLRKISEEEMLKNWALAEVTSVRRQKYLNKTLPEGLIQKIRQGLHEYTEDEWGRLIEMVRSTRSELLKGLLGLDIEWYEGKLPIEELKNLEMMNWPPFVELAGSRKFLDLIRAFQGGKMPSKHHEFAENLERIRKELRPESMQGKPIVLSRSEEPPYILVEGFTRLSAMLLNLLEGKSYGEKISVILGISERLDEWEFA